MRTLAYVLGVAAPQWTDELPPLAGVTADISAMTDLLKARGFEVLTRKSDAETRRGVVIPELDRLIDGLRSGDLFAFYFSGHGMRVPDQDNDEADSWDEGIALSDGFVRDDTFRALWGRLRSGVRVVAVIDACHSDTAVLGFRVGDEPMAVVVRAVVGPSLLVLSACRDADRAFEGAKGDRGGGVVTTTMLDVLAREPQTSYRALWERVATEVRDHYPSLGQTPSLRYSGPDSSLLEATAFTS